MKAKLFLGLNISLLALFAAEARAANDLAAAGSVEQCVQANLPPGSRLSNSRDLTKRCDNASGNYDECKKAADTVRKAVEAHQRAVRETCEKQALAGKSSSGQNSITGDAASLTSDAGKFTDTSAAKLDASAQTASKGKEESEKAIKKVIDDPEKVKPERKGIITKILNTFKDTDYSNVSSAAQYLAVRKKLDQSWNDLFRNPDLAKDQSGDAWEAAATYLNAEEVRLGSSYQKNQMSATSRSLQTQLAKNDANVKGLNEDSNSSGFLGSAGKTLGLATSAMGAAAALSGLAGKNSGSPAGTDSPSVSGYASPGPESVGSTSLSGSTPSGNGLGATKSPVVATGDSAASQLSGGERGTFVAGPSREGSVSPGQGDEPGVGGLATSASTMDTSLRDSLKAKLQAGAAGTEGKEVSPDGRIAAGATGTNSDAKAVAEGKMAQVLAPEAVVNPAFMMPASETDEAVKDLLAKFDADDKGNDTGAATLAQPGTDRQLASVKDSAAGIEGRDGTNLFARVRSTVTRCVKKGYVVHGISNKKI